MNDDFVTQYRREPSPEFRQTLYAKISQPMKTPSHSTRRMRAIGFACAMILMCGMVLLTPGGRAFADQLLYTIGAFTMSEPSTGPVLTVEPTVGPYQANNHTRAADTATASQVAGFSVLDLPMLPTGYAPSGDWTISLHGEGTTVVRGYVNASGDLLTVNQLKAGSNETYDLHLSPNEQATRIDINGAAGLLIEGRLMGNGPLVDGRPLLKPTNWLYWADNGINYTLFADNLTSDQLIEIAEAMD